MIYHLESWSIVGLDPYQAPEIREARLFGIRVEDGIEVVTSEIETVDGKSVTTETGSVYILGTPSQEYLDYLDNQDLLYDETNPIKSQERDTIVDCKICDICGYDHKYQENGAAFIHKELEDFLRG